MNHAQIERSELCDLFIEVGPDQSTLCEGWTTRDLAAHLVVRERRPDAALGILAAPFERHGEKVRREFARRDYAELVEMVRNGPPRLSPMSIGAVDRAANTMEFFIHHEDVRRTLGRRPRDLDPDLAAQLWAVVSRMSKLMLRKAPAGVVLEDPDRGTVVANTAHPSVRVTGPVGELALFIYGRQEHAVVDLAGAETDVSAVRSASFGI